MRAALTFFLSCFLIINCASIVLADGPFGLTWGDSISQLKKKGVDLKDPIKKGRTTIYDATVMPKTPSFSSNFIVCVDEKYNLQKVVMYSKDFTKDIYGSEGKKLYSRLKKTLTEKYGTPETYERIGDKLYKESDEFYQCLKYPGCGSWVSLYKTTNPQIHIVLELRGTRRGEGFLVLHYEGPHWSEIVADKEKKANNTDSDAL